MTNNYTLKLELTLEFTQDANITQKDKEAIIDNVILALRNQVNSGMGLAPETPEIEDGDYITETIEVKHEDGTALKWDMKEDIQI